MLLRFIKRKVSISHDDLCPKYLNHTLEKTKSHYFCTSSWFDSMIKLYKTKYKTHCTKRREKTTRRHAVNTDQFPVAQFPHDKWHYKVSLYRIFWAKHRKICSTSAFLQMGTKHCHKFNPDRWLSLLNNKLMRNTFWLVLLPKESIQLKTAYIFT